MQETCQTITNAGTKGCRRECAPVKFYILQTTPRGEVPGIRIPEAGGLK